MAAPKPSEFNAVVVLPTDNLAVAMVKVFIRFPVLFCRWYVTVFQANGTFTTEFQRKLCDACAKEET